MSRHSSSCSSHLILQLLLLHSSIDVLLAYAVVRQLTTILLLIVDFVHLLQILLIQLLIIHLPMLLVLA